MKKRKFKLLGILCLAIAISFMGVNVVKADTTAHAKLVSLSKNGNYDHEMNCPYAYHHVSFRPQSNPNGASVLGEVRKDDWFHSLIASNALLGLTEGKYTHRLIYTASYTATRWFNGKAIDGSLYGNLQFTNTTDSALYF